MLTKYARAEVIEVKGSPTQIHTASLDKMGGYENFRTEDGFLYARIRAISSRVNKNHDAWPSVEIAGDPSIIQSKISSGEGFTVEAKKGAKYGFSTFVGKPIFVDHNNSNPQRARGVIVDARLHVEPNTDDPYYKTADCHESFKPATWVELLLEIDAKTFPKLAKAIIDGSQDSKKGIDGFSMGANVERSVCSHCANVATNPEEFCKHILGKGKYWDHTDPKTGRKTAKRSYEFCEGCQYFEISAVFDPADETALTREVIASVMKEGEYDLNETLKGVNFHPDEEAVCKNCGMPGHMHESYDGRCPMYPEDAEANYDDAYGKSDLDSIPTVEHPLGPQTGKTAADESKDINAELFGAPTAVQGSPKRPIPWTDDPEKQERLLQIAIKRAAARPNGTAELHEFLKIAGLDPNTLQKVADDKLTPQYELESARLSEDPLNSPLICPVCGAEVDGETCDRCQWMRPPDGFDDPNLTRAHDKVDERREGEIPDKENPGVPQEQSELTDTNLPPAAPAPMKYQPTGHVTNEMARWRRVEAGVLTNKDKPIKAGNKPATNEPVETVIQDQLTPVTSSVRTAADFIAAAGQLTNTGDNMDKVADATAQAPDVAKPKTQVDVTGTGGVDEASNEEASKPSVGEVNVLDKGGVDSDVAPDSTETLPDSSGENDAGFNTDKTTDDSGPTKTWSGDYGDSLGQREPVSDDVFPNPDEGVKSASQHVGYDDAPYPKDDGGLGGGSAQTGNTPIAESFGNREQLIQKDTSPSNNSGPTKTWSGTDGNGVNKQQDPVTPGEVYPSEGGVVKGSSAHLFSAFKLADLEVELGLITADAKYPRVAELENQTPEAVFTALGYAQRVKTAGLGKRQVEAKRLPSLQGSRTKEASVVEAASEYEVELPGESDFATFL